MNTSESYKDGNGGKCKCAGNYGVLGVGCICSMPNNFIGEQQPAEERCKHKNIRFIKYSDGGREGYCVDCNEDLKPESASRSQPATICHQLHCLKLSSTEPYTWEKAALSIGEKLASVGPNNYYSMTPGYWLSWAEDQVLWKDRRIAELVDTAEYLTKAVNDRVHIITDLERQLKESNKRIEELTGVKFSDRMWEAMKEKNETLEQQVGELRKALEKCRENEHCGGCSDCAL